LKKSEVPAFKKRAAEINKLRENAPEALAKEPELVAEIVIEPGHYVTSP